MRCFGKLHQFQKLINQNIIIKKKKKSSLVKTESFFATEESSPSSLPVLLTYPNTYEDSRKQNKTLIDSTCRFNYASILVDFEDSFVTGLRCAPSKYPSKLSLTSIALPTNKSSNILIDQNDILTTFDSNCYNVSLSLPLPYKKFSSSDCTLLIYHVRYSSCFHEKSSSNSWHAFHFRYFCL